MADTVIREFIDRKIEDGHAFEAGAVDRGIRKNESFRLFVDNVSTGTDDRYALAGNVEIQSTGELIINVDVNPTVDSQGTQLTVNNLRTDSNATTTVEVFNGGEYSGGQEYTPTVAPVSGGQATISTVMLAPGDTMLVDAEVRNPGGADISKKFIWVPIQEDIITEVTDIDTGEKI